MPPGSWPGPGASTVFAPSVTQGPQPCLQEAFVQGRPGASPLQRKEAAEEDTWQRNAETISPTFQSHNGQARSEVECKHVNETIAHARAGMSSGEQHQQCSGKKVKVMLDSPSPQDNAGNNNNSSISGTSSSGGGSRGVVAVEGAAAVVAITEKQY